MELHRLRASQVSAAQPLRVIYHGYLMMSNSQREICNYVERGAGVIGVVFFENH